MLQTQLRHVDVRTTLKVYVVCADVERQGCRLTVYGGIEENHPADGVEEDAVRLRFIGNPKPCDLPG